MNTDQNITPKRKTDEEIRARIARLREEHKLGEGEEKDWNLEERAVVELRWALGERE